MKQSFTPSNHCNFTKTVALCATLTAMTAGFASAAVTSITKEGPAIWFTTGIAASGTEGDEIDGLSVTVTYSDSSTATAAFAATGFISGAATAPGEFSMQLTGGTFNAPWSLFNLNPALEITSFTMNGLDAGEAFDATNPNPGTTGSGVGVDFRLFSISNTLYDAEVTYSDPLRIVGEPVRNDLFLTLDVSVAETPIAAFNENNPNGSRLRFIQETDAVLTAITTVPEPTSTLGLAFLLSSSFLLRSRR